MRDRADKILGPLITLAHERLGLSPNQVSTVGFVVGLLAAGVAAAGFTGMGLLLMALSQIIDGVDGGIARRYRLSSARGAALEILYDRLDELCMFLALAYSGKASYEIAVLAFVAILVLTAVQRKSGFDPGAKRFMLYFGWLLEQLSSLRGFEIALQVVFFVNLAAAAVGTVISEYRLQKEVDAKAIQEREQRLAMGLPLPPDDPPSFLSRLFSWR